ncbi:MAG: hypothetical protein AB1714_11950 [Acidobacteriota bacterium]
MIEGVLAEAVETWRRIVELAYPIYAATPVVLGRHPESPAPFEACTDNRRIFVNINNEAELESGFSGFAVPHYRDGAAGLYRIPARMSDETLLRNLEFDTFLFVLDHELLHPLVCPNSRDDERAISRAILAGFKKVRPELSGKELLYFVDNCKNLLWDFVVNVAFLASAASGILREKIRFVFARSARQIEGCDVSKFPQGVVPLMYLLSAKNRRTDVLISLAGLFYSTIAIADAGTRRRSVELFLDDLRAKGVCAPEALDALRGIYRGLVGEMDDSVLLEHGITRAEFLERVDLVADLANPKYGENQQHLLAAIHDILDDPSTRYPAITGIARAIVPFVSAFEKQGSIDQRTSSHGRGDEEVPESSEEERAGSLAQTLEDLSSDLGKEGVDKILREIAGDPNPARPAGSKGKQGAGAGGGFGKATIDALAAFAKDELYKRNAASIEFRMPSAGVALVSLGKQVRWELKSSQDLSSAELASFDLLRVIDAQMTTGLPILMELTADRYKLNEFRLAESPVRGWAPQQYDIDVPDNWVLLVDSSGSMCGDPFDLLLRITYGIKKGIFEICKKRGKDVHFGVVNFSTTTIFGGMDSFLKTYTARTRKTKQVLFEEQNGGTHLEAPVFGKMKKELKPGTTVYTLLTDGYIDNEDEVYKEVEKVAHTSKSAFLYVEVSSASGLGRRLEKLAKSFSNVLYRKVGKIEDIAESLKTVLITYTPAA